MHESSLVIKSTENGLALTGHRDCMKPVREVEKYRNCNRRRIWNYFGHSEALQTEGNARNGLAQVREVACISS